MVVTFSLTLWNTYRQVLKGKQTPDLLSLLAWKWLPPLLLVGTHHFPGKDEKAWDSTISKEGVGWWVSEKNKAPRP